MSEWRGVGRWSEYLGGAKLDGGVVDKAGRVVLCDGSAWETGWVVSWIGDTGDVGYGELEVVFEDAECYSLEKGGLQVAAGGAGKLSESEE